MKKTIPLKTLTGAVALALLLGTGAARAQQNQSIEDRLRTELRNTAQQLQALQTQQAQVNAAKAAAEAQRDAAQAEAKGLRDQLAKASGQVTQLTEQQDKVEAAARGQVQEAGTQLDKYKQAYDELLKLARGKEAERVSVQNTLGQRDAQLAMCTDKNNQMYSAGEDILKAYESISTGDVLKIRQPFAQGARVKFEEAAQAYGDKLYGSKYDPRMPVPAAGQSSAAAPAAAK